MLNRRRCVSFKPPPLGESYIAKVADSEFAVQSKSSIDVVYSVNTERGTSSCHSGATGNMRKHLKSVLIHNHIQSDLLYQGSPEERRYAIFAVELEKASSLSFFANAKSPIDNTSNDFTCSTTSLCDNTDEASVSGPAREDETENEDRNDGNIRNEVPDYYQVNKQQLENFFSTLKAKWRQCCIHGKQWKHYKRQISPFLLCSQAPKYYLHWMPLEKHPQCTRTSDVRLGASQQSSLDEEHINHEDVHQ